MPPCCAKLPQQKTELERWEEWGAHGGCNRQYKDTGQGLNWLSKDLGSRSTGQTIGVRLTQ